MSEKRINAYRQGNISQLRRPVSFWDIPQNLIVYTVPWAVVADEQGYLWVSLYLPHFGTVQGTATLPLKRDGALCIVSRTALEIQSYEKGIRPQKLPESFVIPVVFEEDMHER